MNIVVTGDTGIGKTTVCQKVVDMAERSGYRCGGILSLKNPDGEINVMNIQTKQSEPLASQRNVFTGPRVGKYFFNSLGLEFGVRAINKSTGCPLLFIDELGPLEVDGGGFASALDVLPKCAHSILVVRRELLPTFSPWLSSPTIFTTTLENRDALPARIMLLIAVETFAGTVNRILPELEGRRIPELEAP